MTNEEKMLDILAGMQSGMLEMRNDINTIKNDVLKLNIKLETDIEPRLDALGDGHTAIIERLTPRSRIDDLENEIRFLKTMVFQLGDEVQKLKAV